jgi:predicted nucleic acid-binding protein
VIIFDASFLVVLLHPHPATPKDRDEKPVTMFKERVAYLATSINASGDVIGVPAPAMAEVLVRAGAATPQYLQHLQDTAKFQIIPFGMRAAIEAAELVAKIKAANKSQPIDNWAKVKYDVQIVATARAENATLIYSDDKQMEVHGTRVKLPVIRICDLPLPPAPPKVDKPAEQKPLKFAKLPLEFKTESNAPISVEESDGK